MSEFIRSAQRVLNIEQEAIASMSAHLDASFEQACNMILSCTGKVIVCGMGKSGHIGNKIAATLASTGTPAFFMHPGEANHGDLGMVSEKDLVLAISNSGETSEILALLPVLKRLKTSTIAITGKPNSTLAQHADIHICVAVEKEACSLGLAPTASTTATLAMGDALAIALLDANGFSSDDFAISHPGGSLGRKLLLTFKDVMLKGSELPLVNEKVMVPTALMEISAKGLGMVGITNAQGQLLGIFTDGDLRRVLDSKLELHSIAISHVMTRDCVTTQVHALAAEVLTMMEKHKISALFAVDENHVPIGATNMHQLLKAGVA